MQPVDDIEKVIQPSASARLRLFRPKDPYVALGLTVTHLMVKPAFAKLRFGDWSRILVGQINRGHYCFAIDEKNQIQGFLGWAFTTRDKAEAWVTGRSELSFEDSRQGDCVIINALTVSSSEVGRLMRDAVRSMGPGRLVFFKRHYEDGTVRATRVRIRPAQTSGGEP